MIVSPPRIAYTDAIFQIQVKVTHVVVSRLAMRLTHVIERNPSVIVNATHGLFCQAPIGDRPSALQQVSLIVAGIPVSSPPLPMCDKSMYVAAALE